MWWLARSQPTGEQRRRLTVPVSTSCSDSPHRAGRTNEGRRLEGGGAGGQGAVKLSHPSITGDTRGLRKGEGGEPEKTGSGPRRQGEGVSRVRVEMRERRGEEAVNRWTATRSWNLSRACQVQSGLRIDREATVWLIRVNDQEHILTAFNKL